MAKNIERVVEYFEYVEEGKTKQGIRLLNKDEFNQEDVVGIYKSNISQLEKVREQKKNMKHELENVIPKKETDIKKFVKELEKIAKPIVEAEEAKVEHIEIS